MKRTVPFFLGIINVGTAHSELFLHFKIPISTNLLTSVLRVASCTFGIGFDNPRQQKPHRNCALGITMLSNSAVSEHVKMRSLRHSRLKIHERYQRLTYKSIGTKNEAMNPLLCTSSPIKTPPLMKKKQPITNSSQENTNVSQKIPTFSTPCYHIP